MIAITQSWVVPTRDGWVFFRREENRAECCVRFHVALDDESPYVMSEQVSDSVLIQTHWKGVLERIFQNSVLRLARIARPPFATEGELAYQELWKGWAL